MTNRICTPLDMPAVQEWYRQALNDPQIHRFMSVSLHVSQIEIKPDNWDQVVLMDATNTGLAILNPVRSSGSQNANVCLWVLPSARRRMIAGSLIYDLMLKAIAPMGIKWLEWCCHETNDASLKLVHDRVALVGVRVEAAWDSHKSCWVDQYDYRISVADALKQMRK